jgi:hypothetical protein
VPAGRGRAFRVGDAADLRVRLVETIAAVRARGVRRLAPDPTVPDLPAQFADFRRRYAALRR